MNKRVITYPLILGIVVLLSTFLLAFVYNITKPIIEENAIIRENQVVLDLFPGAEIKVVEGELTKDEKDAGLTSVVKVDENYVYTFNTKGFKEGFVFLIAIDGEGNFNAFHIVSSMDTPGHVDNVRSKNYSDIFIDKSYDTEFGDNLIITGSTYTSGAVADAVKIAGQHYGRIK